MSSKLIEGAKGHKGSSNPSFGATKTALVEVQELFPPSTTLAQSKDAEERSITVEENAKASKSPYAVVEEIPVSPIPLESVRNVESREVTIGETDEAFQSLPVKVEEQTSRYHEDNTAQYCLPNEQVHSNMTQSLRT
jgi:hypothetical protein